MQNKQQRRKLVTWAIAMTEGTSLAPTAYELQLLEEYVSGAFSIEEVIELVASASMRPASATQDAEDCLPITPPRDAF